MEDELNAEQVDADDIYDEDFEDYEDDGFESEEQEDDEPNEETVTATQPPTPPPPTYAQVASGRRVIESLLKAKCQTLSPGQSIAAAARARRWALIRTRLTHVVMAPILDMPPRTLSELHASGQGAAARLSVKGVQTRGEGEIRTVELQTEDVPMFETASQYNAQDLLAARLKELRGGVNGGHAQNGRLAGLLERALQALDQGRLGKTGLVDRVVSLMSHPRVQKYRAVQEILSFVKSAVRSAVGGKETGETEGGDDEERQLADLLEEALQASEGRSEETAQSMGHSGTPSTSTYYHGELLRGRPLLSIALSPPSDSTHPPLLLCCYGPSSGASIAARLGCLCVWETSKPSRPWKVLVCEGDPSSCCWAPANNSTSEESGRGSRQLVVVGTDSGSLSLWDLSEPASQHQDVRSSQGEVLTLRRPSYMTDWRLELNHAARVCAISAQLPSGSGNRAGLENGLEGGSGAVAEVLSLDCSGCLNVWSAVSVTRLDSAVVETDFGLRLGSRVRLLRVASVNCLTPGRGLGFEGLCKGFEGVYQIAVGLATIPGDASQLLVATEGGNVVRASRFGLPAANLPRPQSFARKSADVSGWSPTSVLTSASSRVTCLLAHPVSGDHFLVSHSDDAIALYSLQLKLPLREWRGFAGGEVWGFRWCPGRPAAFFALDSRSVLHFFDLLRDASRPVGTLHLGSAERVSKRERHGTNGVLEDGVFDLSGVSGAVTVAFAEGAQVRVTRIDENWTAGVPNELNRFREAAARRFAG